MISDHPPLAGPSNAVTAPDARAALYTRMRPAGLTPLWEVLHALVPQQPTVRTQPALWRWQDVEPFLEEAGRLISAEEAVRRVLILENPGWRGESRVTSSLYAGLQRILPGEVAPSHRHTQSALRFVVAGRGAYTAVDGERTTMAPGDFIITPHWTWHDHGNDGAESVTWLDGLDIPIVAFFESGFSENGVVKNGVDENGLAETARIQAVSRAEGSSLARYGASMLPLTPQTPFGRTSPIFCYPYPRSRDALAHLAAHADLDPVHGAALRYANPVDGGHAIPTMATRLQLLPKGFGTQPARTTAGTVYSVVEGGARIDITPLDGPAASYRVGPRDHFVVPPWARLRIDAVEETVLFAFSDEPLQQAAGIHRSEVE